MEAKKYLYAAVGAPVAVAKTTQDRVEEIRAKVEENLRNMGEDAQKRIDSWADTGESAMGKITDAKTIDELTTRVDFDQVQTQVNKLRDQLEDLVATWRSNFRPVTEAPVEPASRPSDKPAAKKPAAKKPAAAAAKKPAAKKPAAKKPAAKKPAAKTTTAKKPAAKKTTAKAS